MSRPAFEKYSPDELDKHIQALFDQREAEEKPLTLDWLAMQLGCSVETLRRYHDHEPKEGAEGEGAAGTYDAHCEAVKKAFRRCGAWNADQLYSGRPVGAIFYAKCRYGFQETPTRLEVSAPFLVQVDLGASHDSDDS